MRAGGKLLHVFGCTIKSHTGASMFASVLMLCRDKLLQNHLGGHFAPGRIRRPRPGRVGGGGRVGGMQPMAIAGGTAVSVLMGGMGLAYGCRRVPPGRRHRLTAGWM